MITRRFLGKAYQPRNGVFCAVIITLLIFGSGKAGPDVNETEIKQEAIKVYSFLLKELDLSNKLLYKDNITGRIVWNEQYLMNSLINMYIATGEYEFLEMLRVHIENILNARDDVRGIRDVYGRTLPGWSAGGYYTLGVPYAIYSSEGKPVLSVQGIHRSGNNETALVIKTKEESKFTVEIINNFRNKGYRKLYQDLTAQNVEMMINENLSPDSYIYVRLLSRAVPKSGTYMLKDTYTRVFAQEHNGIILLPILRYLYLAQYCNISKDDVKYSEQIKELLLPSLNLILQGWVREGESGYFVSEPVPTYWAAGLPVPYNYLSANGLAFLYAHKVYNNEHYKNVALKLARKVKSAMEITADGYLRMPYWYGLPYRGWSAPEPQVVPIYKRGRAFNASEDISHFMWSLWFISEIHNSGFMGFSEEFKAIAKTFLEKILPRDPEGQSANNMRDWGVGVFLAHNLQGSGHAYDYAAAMFALLKSISPDVYSKVYRIYKIRFSNVTKVTEKDIDYYSGVIMLGWSILARGDKISVDCPSKN